MAGESLRNGWPEGENICQLQYINHLGQKNNWIVEYLQISIIKMRYFRRAFFQLFRRKSNVVSLLTPGQIQPGDRVRVRSRREIQHTLDRRRRTRGCTFQLGMYDYCGREFRVYKKVENFFDERKGKMCKCKGLFLLEGACCNGETAYLAACGRNCFYFWQTAWLEKI